MSLHQNISVLDNLNSEVTPLWGSMTPQHMVEHLTIAVRSSNGGLEINEFMTPVDKLPTLKRILMSERPLPKNFVNTVIGEGLQKLRNENLDSAKKELFSEIDKYEKYFIQHPEAKPINATFGPLDKSEWDQFHKKHFKHHLEQFGLTSK